MMKRQPARVSPNRSRSVSFALVVMLSALMMLAVSACNKNQEQNALDTSQPSAASHSTDHDHTEHEHSAPPASGATDDAMPPATEEAGPPPTLDDTSSELQEVQTPTAADGRAPDESLQPPTRNTDALRAAAQRLDGHWLLDAEATLQLLPEESREGLREVFKQVRTGVSFTKEGEAVMNVVAEGEKNEQEGKYAVADTEAEAVRIEFLIDDEQLVQDEVRIFATVVFEDEDTVHYQASTEQKGQVVQREQVAVMKRVSPEVYNNALR